MPVYNKKLKLFSTIIVLIVACLISYYFISCFSRRPIIYDKTLVKNLDQQNITIILGGCRKWGLYPFVADACMIGFTGLFDPLKNRFIWKKFILDYPRDIAFLKSIGQCAEIQSHKVVIRAIKNGKILAKIGPTITKAIAYSPDGKYLMLGDIEGLVKIFDTKSFATIRTLNFPKYITSISFDNKYGFIAVSCGDKLVHIIDQKDFHEIHSIEEIFQLDTKTKFSQDGKLFAIYNEPIMKIIAVPLFTFLFKIEPYNANGIEFSNDGKYFFTSKTGEPIEMWDVAKQDKIRSTSEVASRNISFTKDGKYFSAADVTDAGKISILFWRSDFTIVRKNWLPDGYNVYFSYIIEE